MKYMGMTVGMWYLFLPSFRKNLNDVLGFEKEEAEKITRKAKEEYKRIIEKLPEFEKGDRFKMNIISCAMLSSFILNMDRKPSVQEMEKYYNDAMMVPFMKWFCKKMGKKKFSQSDLDGMEKTAKLNAADRNPYSWNMDLLPYEDGSGYEARFYHCGICTLMKELGTDEYTSAMCKLDYAMAEAGGVCDFIREYTLASGGPYCDCAYKKKI